MKIAIIVRKLNTKGGTQRQAIMLARDLKQRGHNVTLYTFLYSPADCYEAELRELHVVALGSYPRSSRFFFWKEYTIARRLSMMIDRDTELLNPHDQVSYRVAAYFKRGVKNVPSVWMMNDLPTKVFSLMRDGEMNSALHPCLLRKMFARISDWFDIHRFISVQDVITVLSDRDRAWVQTYFHREAVVVRNGIEGDVFQYVEHEIKGERVNLLMSGIFFPHRRFEDGIEAVKLLVDAGIDVYLTIIGGMDKTGYAEYIRGLIASLDLEARVTLRGKVSEEELKSAYLEHDIFLFPNHLQSWGIAVFEAIASGLPVVVSRTSGAAEVLQDGTDALLVDPKHPNQIMEAVLRLRADPELYKGLAKNGRALVEQKISWKNYADSMVAVFANAVKGRD